MSVTKKRFGLHFLFLIAGGVLSLPWFLADSDNTVDINVHDTYFIIQHSHIGTVLIFLHLLYAGIYFVSRNYLNYTLGLIQLIMQSIFFFWILLFMLQIISLSGVPRRYYTNSELPSFGFDDFVNYRALA